MRNTTIRIIISGSICAGMVQASYASPDLPLLQQENLIHKGTFRVPSGRYGIVSTHSNSFTTDSGRALSYNPKNNSIFMVGHTLEVLLAELGVPNNIVKSNNRSDLTTATVLQNPIDITGGLGCYIGPSSSTKCNGGTTMKNGNVLIGGTLVDEVSSKIYGTTYTVYDGTANTTLSHFKSNLDWTNNGVGASGMYRVGKTVADNGALSAGFVDGYMAWIPTEWRLDFGGPAITGHGPMAIISRTSSGPAAFVFNPEDLGINTVGMETNPAPMTPLVYYPLTHQTLGSYDNLTYSNPTFNNVTEVTGAVWPSGTRSLLFFGRTGLGTPCYGAGTANQSEAANNATIVAWIAANGTNYPCGTTTLDGSGNNFCCYDPAGTSFKGVHNYPYAYYVWAYDALDLLAVKNGIKKPWEVKPYAEWNLESDLAVFAPSNGARRIFGAAYDQASQRIFISQSDGDPGTYESRPLIQVFQVQTGVIQPVKNLTGTVIQK